MAHIAFRIVKEWFKGAPTVFATDFAPHGECECVFEGEQEWQERESGRRTTGSGGLYSQVTTDLVEEERTEEEQQRKERLHSE